MKTIWICLVVAVVGVTSTSFDDHYYDDYWYEGGDKSSYFDDDKDPLKTDSDENNKNFESENDRTTNSFTDYLVEDNRLNLDENDFESAKGTTLRKEVEQSGTDILSTSPEVESKETVPGTVPNSPDGIGENIDNLEDIKDSDEKLFRQTTAILDEYTKNDFIDIKPELEDMETNDELKKIYEETSSLLNESEETIDENDKDVISDEQIDSNERNVKLESETEKQNDGLNDLMADLDTLKKTREELASDDISDYDKIDISASDEDYEEIDDANFERLFKDINNDDSDNVDESNKDQASDKVSEPIRYLYDAIIDSDNETDIESIKTTEAQEVTSTVRTITPVVHAVEKLSEEDVDGEFEDFTSRLSDIVITSDDVRNAKNVRLSIDTPEVITSPDYPQPYPTDTTTDWMITGNAPRPGAVIAEPDPEPEEPEYSPVSTITLNLGGVSLQEFLEVEEDFRGIIADMATMYINFNGIDPGLKTTLETTTITSRALCYHNWPKFERCAEIRFGVPLIYNDTTVERLNETDLLDMWSSYNQRDPFAVRLRMLGIKEFQIPNDGGVLTVWMVIAGGVLISIALLGFVLWRYSCFAEYTRMPSFSDTDSVNEKRKLDLYPTPHQSLPPLYSEIDYQWADAKYEDTTKVQIGGYSNKSYMQNDVYDIDSDEDALPARDRSSSFSPRDIYKV